MYSFKGEVRAKGGNEVLGTGGFGFVGYTDGGMEGGVDRGVDETDWTENAMEDKLSWEDTMVTIIL